MMVKIGNEYLDFNDDIEIERQAKLFEELSTTDGDYSYQFEAPGTSHNIKILGNPFPDNILKPVYQKIDAQVISDDGLQLYDGFLRVEGLTNVIKLAFFAGNNNWFGLLSGPLSDIDFSDLDLDQSQSNIQSAIFNTEGVVFPVVDSGVLLFRGFNQLKVEDFVAGVYVKTIFKRIFRFHSIKIQGDLLNDVAFNSIITLRNGKSEAEINSRSAYVAKTIPQSFNAAPGTVQLTWDVKDTFPYYDNGNLFDLTTETFNPDVRMTVKFELFLEVEQPPLQSVIFDTQIRINGTMVQEVNTFTASDDFTVTKTFVVSLLDTDVVDFAIEKIDTPDFDIVSATVKITPTYIYRAFGNAMVPNWTQQEYVSNILRLFNVLTHFNQVTKTLTFNLFEKLKSTEPIDLSEYIEAPEVDYVDFISGYGKRNLLSYQDVDLEDLRSYNISNFFKYSQGVIEVNNDFLEDSKSIIESDFSNPQAYINNVFDMSIERLNIIDLEEDITVDVTGVTDSLGKARFAVAEDVFLLSDLVRIENSTNPTYNGDFMVVSLGVGWIELSGVNFLTDARAEVSKMNFVYNESDDVFLMWHVPLYPVANFSGNEFIRLENTDLFTVALSYFALLNTNRQINLDYKQSLSFGEIEDPLFYQRTLIQTYWGLVSGILNDPVKLISVAHLPYNVFLKLDFLRCITIKTLESSNLYYLNRISGYRGSERAALLELIKLSSLTKVAVIPQTPPVPPVEAPQILQAIQFGIATGNVLDFNFTDPMTIGSKVLFVGCNVANGATSPTVSETTGNVNMGNSIDVGRHLMKDPTGATNIGYVFFEVIDITDVDDAFQFTFSAADGNTHYSAGFAVEISPGAEWDTSYLGLVDSAIGYDTSSGLPKFTTGVLLSSVPNVVTTQAGNLFIPFGFSMGLSPDGNFFQAPFDGVNPSGSVNPAGVLMGMVWNAVELASGDAGPLVYETNSGISGVRQWLSWGNFYTP